MDILFITATDFLKLNAVSNGTMLLGTKLLKAGFEVDILRFCQIKNYKKDYHSFIIEITERILRSKPKCVSFYTLWPYIHIILRIAKEIKKHNKDIIIILGGPHSSATAHDIMQNYECIDYICTGEGENTVVPFFSSVLKNGRSDISSIAGLYYRDGCSILHNSEDPSLCDLNALPYWDDRLLKAWNPLEETDIQSKYYYMPIDAGRGCPYSCTFCSTSNFWHRTYRLKSADRIIQDIIYYNQKYGIRSFWFTHDAFTSNMRLVSDFCDKLLELNLDIAWRCTTRVDCLSEDLLQKMIRSGLQHIEIGIETGSPRMQKIINKRLNLDYAKKMIKNMVDNNLFVEMFFIYGFPNETEADLNQTLEFLFSCLDHGAKKATMGMCRFAPGTQLTIDNYDLLCLDDEINQLSRNTFGYNEEIEDIKKFKSIYSSFYNLKTDLRWNYQYLYYFEWIYEKRVTSMRFIRKLYHGDNLSFYTDFYKSNKDYFNDLSFISNAIKNESFELLNNLVNTLTAPCAPQLKSILEFEHDIETVHSKHDDIAIQKQYNFSYLDYLEDASPEFFTNYKTELLIEKKNNVFSVQMIDIQPS